MDPTEAPDHGRSEWNGTPFGGDGNTLSHIQGADLSAANKTLPGEAEDPRLC